MTAATALHAAFGSGAVFLGVVGVEIVAAGLMLWLAVSTGRRWTVKGAEAEVVVPRPPR